MGKSKITRTKLSEEIDALSAAVEDGKATIVSMTETIKTLSIEVAGLEKAMSEATALRSEETAKNAVTVEDAQAAQKAVEAATAVLRDFYEKAMTATALVQGAAHARQPAALMAQGYGLKETIKMGSEEWNSLANPTSGGPVDTGHKEGMQTFGESYQGQQDENDFGVMAMLEVIQSDFANLEADTKAAEAASQTGYDNFMTESKKSKAVKTRKVEMTEADKASTESKLREDISDLKATQDQLLAAERYYDNLVPQCVDKGMTYEERTKAREQEVASLKQALTILGSEDIDTSAL
jgi:regulator of replication initiation timing